MRITYGTSIKLLKCYHIKEMPLDSFLDKISMTSLREVEDNESKLNPWGFVIAIIGVGIVFVTASPWGPGFFFFTV